MASGLVRRSGQRREHREGGLVSAEAGSEVNTAKADGKLRASVSAPVRLRFGAFVLSPRVRQLTRDGVPIPLIPKYFDLLVLLVRRRHEAVSKQHIFEQVWSDVVVSDGALAQAVRTLRRTLGDDSREPRYIRTVSRHGYQFVWPDVLEEPDDEPAAAPAAPRRPETQSREGGPASPKRPEIQSREGGTHPTDPTHLPHPTHLTHLTHPTHPTHLTHQTELADLIEQLLAATARAARDEARDIAERLHALGTAEAMARLSARPHHAAAVAIMRDARWNVPGAGDVPLLFDREAIGAIAALVGLRIADARRTIALRWASAAAAGALGGALSGTFGGILLTLSPGSNARPQSAVALAAVGALAGSVGAGGVAAGLAAAEALARSRRGLALVACGSIAGAIVAAVSDLVLRALLEALFGVRLFGAGSLPYGTAAIDGLVIGAAAGAGYALATAQPPGGGIAAPHGARRARTIAMVGLSCAIGAALLALAGRLLVGGMVHELARQSPDAQLVLAPLGRLIGEPDFGPVTRLLLSASEGGMFGCALAWGFTHRPPAKSR
jgi:DNA-binding winged helix-turn-helix (wHTH) protein